MNETQALEPPSELVPYLNLHRWEAHLSEAQRHQLAWYRAVAAEDEEVEGTFFVELQANRESWEFPEALDEAGSDPVARAEAFYQLHLDSYPFWLGEGESEEADGC